MCISGSVQVGFYSPKKTPVVARELQLHSPLLVSTKIYKRALLDIAGQLSLFNFYMVLHF